MERELELALRMATKAISELTALKNQIEMSMFKGEKGDTGLTGREGLPGKDGKDGQNGANGKNGQDGAPGPAPEHEVSGNSVRFKNPDGTWGKWLEFGGRAGGGGGDTMRYQINTFTAATVQLKDIHSTVLCDCSSNAISVTLPRAKSMVGRVVTVKKVDSTTNKVTIDGYASETIDGDTTVTIPAQWTSLRLQSDGNNWVIM